MRHHILSVTEAKARLLELARLLEQEGRAYVLTKNGLAVGALVPIEDYEAMVETLEILDNPSLMKKIHKALKEEKKEQFWEINPRGKWVRSKKIKSPDQ